MINVRAVTGVAWEDGGFSLLARILGPDGELITQAGISSISRKVFQTSGDTPDTATSTATVTVVTTVYDSLQTGHGWTADTTGYNFRDDLPASVLSAGGHVYQVEWLFTPASGAQFFMVAEITAKAVRTS